MFRVRLNPFSNTEEKFDIKEEGENLKEMVTSYLCYKGFHQDQYKHFVILWKGEEIPLDLASEIQVSQNDEVLVSPRVNGGDFGQLFKVGVVIAATIAASVIFPPSAFGVGAAGAFASAAVVAAVSIGTTLLMSALIPPPDAGSLGLGGLGDSINSSQMYSLTGQSNQAKKYQTVPKVYGSFKLYPNIVAQPYTDIEVDASTGKLVQVLYSVYDFGLGPLHVSDLRIGNTPISDFSDIEYNFVDPNRPTTSEGYWDDQVLNDFRIYKGDVEIAENSYSLNFNSTGYNPGGSVDDYRVERTLPTNSNLVESEIIVSGIFPKGIGAFSASGTLNPIEVQFVLEFSLEGENNWKGWNDFKHVSYFNSSRGAYTTGDPVSLNLPPSGDYIFTTPVYTMIGPERFSSYYLYSGAPYGVYSIRDWGYAKGATTIYTTSAPTVGKALVLDGISLGKVNSVTPQYGYYRVNFATPLERNVIVLTSKDSISYSTPTLYVGNPNGRAYYVTNSNGTYTVDSSDRAPFYTSLRFTPRVAGSYKIRLTRVRTTGTEGSVSVLDEFTYLSSTVRFNSPVVNTQLRHTFLELKVRATNQLNGNLDTLNGQVQSILPVYNGSDWVLQFTDNPAWIFADMLTGAVNKRAVSRDRLHLDSLVEWANYAEEIPPTPPGNDTFLRNRFSCNFILDFSTTLKGVLDSVCGSAQASLNIIDGKYGVLLDRKRDIPVQVFTPRNYSSFTAVKSYSGTAEGVKVKYNSETDGWKLTTRTVYEEGFNKDNLTTELEEIQSFGITNAEQAWRFGRFMLSQYLLRQETISIQVDFENLVCTRGDYVQITQDSMKVGGRPARVKTVVGNRITIDDSIETSVGPSYGYVVRSVSGVATDTLTVVDSNTFDLDGTLPEVGDLIVIGEVGNIVYECIVKGIQPIDDNAATLTLVEKADGVYDSMETGTVSPFDPQLTDSSNVVLDPPGEVQYLSLTDNYYEAGEGRFNYFLDFSWQPPLTGGTYDLFEVYVDSGAGFNYINNTSNTSFTYAVGNANVGVEHRIKVLAVGAGGSKLNIGEVGFIAATPERKSTPPADVENFGIDLTNQVLQVSWDLLPASEGVLEYLVRYSPTLGDNWFNSIPLTKTDSNTSSTSVQARKGTYLIKAIDFEGNESAKEALAITSIPGLFDLNVIEETNDFPLLEGSFANVEKLGASDQLVLQEENPGQYFNEGFYYFKEFLDLGAIYTVRLQSLIRAAGYTAGNLMTNWVTLSSVDPLSASTSADWDVQTQVRYTNKRTVMGNWNPLSDVTSMTEGDIDDWNDWQSFVMGDFTGRTFQFRLKLISNLPSVSPKVIDGVIRSDMPDRTESQDNLTSSASGTTVTYSVPFKGPSTTPAIQITQDNAQQGDYYTISNKTLESFDITFYDLNDVAVVRTFDVLIRGHGYENDQVI